MIFKIKQKQFNNDGAIYSTKIVAKKINGYKVINPEGNETFVCFDDIEILELSEEEQNL